MSNEYRMGNQPPLNVPTEHLAAEIERLQKVVDDQALTIVTLSDELGKTRSPLDTHEVHVLANENARLHLALGTVEARLKWFEELYARISLPGRVTSAQDLQEYERAYPRPHDPDALDKSLGIAEQGNR